MNPADLLLTALMSADLEPRLAEALPWAVWQHPHLNWMWLVAQAKRHDLQNRLGFVVALTRAVAGRHQDAPAVAALSGVVWYRGIWPMRPELREPWVEFVKELDARLHRRP